MSFGPNFNSFNYYTLLARKKFIIKRKKLRSKPETNPKKHTLTSRTAQGIVEMLESNDETSIKMGLEILRKSNVNICYDFVFQSLTSWEEFHGNYVRYL